MPYGSAQIYTETENWNSIETIYSLKDGTRYYPITIEDEDLCFKETGTKYADVYEGEELTVQLKESGSLGNEFIEYGTQDLTTSLRASGECKITASQFFLAHHALNRIVRGQVAHSGRFRLAEAGDLMNLVDLDNLGDLKYVKLTGDVNGTDIVTISRMENVVLLDLSETNIVEGGMAYDRDSYTSNNTIGPRIFSKNTKLEYILLPQSITRIDKFAFYDNTYSFDENTSLLKEIKLYDGIQSIDSYAFSGCKNLSSIELPSSITSIGEYTFWGCSSLYSVKLPSSITSIAEFTFHGCSSLTSIVIPDGVDTIRTCAFEDCGILSSVELPAGLKTLGGGTFSVSI